VNQTNATKRIGTSVETTLDAEFAELWAEPTFGSLLWFCRFQNVSLVSCTGVATVKQQLEENGLKLYLDVQE
jgi:hypothetical protein